MFKLFGSRKQSRRVLILGLDCASPDLVFEQFSEQLPTLSRLRDKGTWGILRSSIPCITVPAWSSMTSSRDPGVLGIYGFRNRATYDYDSLSIADGRAVKEKRIWDYVGEAGKQSLVMNVPQTYPVQPIAGHLASGFLSPDVQAQFTYPAIFKQEILKQAPQYLFDVRDFRHMERADLYQRLIDLMDVQYTVFERALHSKSWDFAMHVHMGVDRLHHAFWRYHDPQHRLHEPDSPFKTMILDYYKRVDQWIGRIIDRIDSDVTVMVVSDHGVKRMDGAIAINEWLWHAGWLTFKEAPTSIMSFSHEMVDWGATRAWSTGGYYGRIFLNVAGREPQGIIPPEQYEQVRDDLAQALLTIPDNHGHRLSTRIFKPQAIYQAVNRIAPDLMVYFGDLHWRCVGSVGYGQHYTLENDIGADDANHAEEGLFIMYDPQGRSIGQMAARQLMDIAPTVLAKMGIRIPETMQGQLIE